MKRPIGAICLGLMAVSAAPAAAFEFTQGGSIGFGVVYDRDHETGERRLRPGMGAELNMGLSRDFDNGMRLEFRFGIGASNLPLRDRGWSHDRRDHPHHEQW